MEFITIYAKNGYLWLHFSAYAFMNVQQPTSPAARWKIFPNALDFIVMTVWVFLSQLVVITFVTSLGVRIPDLGAVHSADADTSLTASLDIARTLAIIYTPSMLLATAGILLYRRLRRGTGRTARFSPAGLNPSLILTGFIWMLSAEIVLEPLLTVMPDIPDTVGRGFFALLVTVILAPVFEEFLCRGIILESFRGKYGDTVGWLCSSIFFALIHGQITSMVNALVIGSILGCICIRSRSVFAPMILHALNNGMALTTISLGLSDSTFAELIPDRRIYFAVYAAATVVCLAGAVTLFLTFRKPHDEPVSAE